MSSEFSTVEPVARAMHSADHSWMRSIAFKQHEFLLEYQGRAGSGPVSA